MITIGEGLGHIYALRSYLL